MTQKQTVLVTASHNDFRLIELNEWRPLRRYSKASKANIFFV